MFSRCDTIVAIATPPGRGGLGVVRVSGSRAGNIADALREAREPLEPRRATLTRVTGAGGALDQAVVTYFPSPHSYTGDDVIEISAHGSPVLLQAIVQAAVEHGARIAEPGEFTFRAYLNRRIDLVQAEAVQDLVEAVTPLQARAAFDQLEGTLTNRIQRIDAALFDLCARLEASLDFPGEGYHFVDRVSTAGEIDAVIASLDELLADARRGRLVRQGAQVAIAGKPNCGKSSLFNRLAGAGRAIVTDIPGTTRDLLTELVDLEGLPLTIIDTAGMRIAPADAVESEGMSRARSAYRIADLTLVVLDRSRPLDLEDDEILAMTDGIPRLIVANKSDLEPQWLGAPRDESPQVTVSAKTGEGFGDLRRAIVAALGAAGTGRDTPAVTNARHAGLMERARAALARASAAAAEGTPEEFVAADVNEARSRLEEVTGARTADDVLHAIFDRFCIGK